MDMAMQRTLYERNRIPPHCMTNYIKAKIEKKTEINKHYFYGGVEMMNHIISEYSKEYKDKHNKAATVIHVDMWGRDNG